MAYRNRFDAILFDLDGTMIETAPDLAAALNHTLAQIGQAPLPLAQVRPLIGDGAKALLRKGLGALELSAIAEEGAHALPAGVLAAGDEERAMAALYDIFIEHYSDNLARRSRPFPGFVDILDRFQADGRQLGVCTNKPVGLSRKLLFELGLLERFGAVLGGDSLAQRKPDARHVTGVLDRLGVAAERAVFIGDSANDVQAARNAGLPVVLVSFGYTLVPAAELGADAVIDHFDELIDALGSLA